MPRRDLAKEKDWRRLLRQWRASGLSGRDFCVEQRLSEPSFYAWRREIARRDQQRKSAPSANAAASSSLAPQQPDNPAHSCFRQALGRSQHHAAVGHRGGRGRAPSAAGSFGI